MMQRLFLLLAILASALLSGAAQAQGGGVPGDTLTWERVGDRVVGGKILAFDGSDQLYAAAPLGITYRLDLTSGFPGVWEERSTSFTFSAAMIGLGPDSLISTRGGRVDRSTDGGATWAEVYDGGDNDNHGLYEAPAGTPAAGRLFLGDQPYPATSADRGATWTTLGNIPDGDANAFAVLPTGSPHAGRLVAGCLGGGAYSDDGGQTWAYASLWDPFGYSFHDLAVVEAPGAAVGSGAARVVTVGADSAQPHLRAWYSDDGGATWLPEAGVPLPQPALLGLGNTAGVLALGGPAVLAVLGRGLAYASEDGGETWALRGEVPDLDEDTYVQTAVLGPDGRVYVGLTRQGSAAGDWVYRSVERVGQPVAVEPGPDASESLGLTVRPNPASDTVTAVLTLAAPAEVETVVYDALGRRVAVLHTGLLPAGPHAFTFDGAALPTGVYVVQAESEGVVATRRFTLVR